MADISLIDPYSAQQESIARRRRMAQALQQQAQAPMETPQMPGVLISPYAGLAKVLQGVYGGYQEAEADKEYRALAEEARTNQTKDLATAFSALNAPAIPGVEGKAEVPYEPPQIEQIYGTKPAPIKGTGFGSGMLMPDQVIGEKVIKPEIKYQAGVTAVPGVPAGFISPALLENIKDPTARNLLLARALKQTELETPIKASPGDVFYTASGKRLFGVPAAAAKGLNPEWKEDSRQINGKTVAGWINLNAETPASTFVAGGKPEKGKEITPHWVSGQKIIDKKPVFGWYDLNAGDSTKYEESFKTGAIPPAGEKSNWKEVTRNNKIVYQDFNIADPKEREASSIDKESVPVKKIRMDVTNEDGSTQTVLMDETDPQFAKGFVTKGPEYVSITTVNSKGETEVRQVKRNDEILKTGYVKPLEGFFGQLQALGVPIKDWRNNPALAEMVNRYFVKGVGGSDIEDVAGYDLQKMKVLAELGYQGIRVPQSVLDKLNIKATPGLLGGATTNALPLPKDKDKKKLINGQTYQTDQGPAKWDAALGQFVN